MALKVARRNVQAVGLQFCQRLSSTGHTMKRHQILQPGSGHKEHFETLWLCEVEARVSFWNIIFNDICLSLYLFSGDAQVLHSVRVGKRVSLKWQSSIFDFIYRITCKGNPFIAMCWILTTTYSHISSMRASSQISWSGALKEFSRTAKLWKSFSLFSLC